MLHPSTHIQFINNEIGHGVFATQRIPKGTITWVFDCLDREMTPAEMERLPDLVQETALTYSYRNAKGNFILCWDLTRYVNHSFSPNCMITPYGFEIAIADIEPGDQLFNDYGTLNILEPFTPLESSPERTSVYPNDIETFHNQFDEQIQSAILQLPFVHQPLKKLIDETTWNKAMNVAQGRSTPKSILECLFDPNTTHQKATFSYLATDKKTCKSVLEETS